MREYDYIPRPRTESHHHIRELFEQQDKRVFDRQYHRDRIKENEEREEEIEKAQAVVLTDFWCDACKKDFTSHAIKQVEEDWSNLNQRKAFYKTKCFKGHWVIRLITDKWKDKFWQKSKLLALDRGKGFLDALQPFETGYNMLYKKI